MYVFTGKEQSPCRFCTKSVNCQDPHHCIEYIKYKKRKLSVNKAVKRHSIHSEKH